MKESFLHLIWQQQLFNKKTFKSTENKNISIYDKGTLNNLQGPDFTNAIIEVDTQKWAGNVEIHVKSSDWYAHQHQKDKNYNNVILHVVYEHDVAVFDLHSNEIPTLELKNYISEKVLSNYNELMGNAQQWIFCENSLKQIDKFKLNNWLERLYIERLERKVDEVAVVYENSGNDWEATLFLMLSKYFGGNLNGQSFLEAFSQVDFTLIRKQIVNKTVHSFLFGLIGLLEDEEIEDPYYLILQKEFRYQKQKYQLTDLRIFTLHFYGCRPLNFPTIRLAQLIAFYEVHMPVFRLISTLGTTLEKHELLFRVSVNSYWQKQYHFNKPSKKSGKKISKSFTNLLLINVVIPVLFLYYKTKGDAYDVLIELMYEMEPEKNSILSKFQTLGCKSNSALQSQALLTLKKEYCDKQRCVECAVGVTLIKNYK